MGLCGRQYDQVYRGVFKSPLDCDLAHHDGNLARLKKLNGMPLTEKEIKSCARLKRLEELGGIQEIREGPLSIEEHESLIKMFQDYRESHALN